MKSKESESVVVLGIDDTVKAAGHRKHDVKAAGHRKHDVKGAGHRKHDVKAAGHRKHDVKAAGHRKHDVKAGHLTVVSKEKVRSNYSIGYLPNKAVKYVLSTMAVLASTTYESVKESIDLLMIDRDGEGKLMLSELGVEEEKKHNCNAHIILCESNCLDKVFRTTEDRIGKKNLISTNASHCFNSPRTS